MSIAQGRYSTSDGLPPRNMHRRTRSDVQSGFISIVPPAAKFEPSCDAVVGTTGERKSDGNIDDDLFHSFLNLDGFRVAKSLHQQTMECGNSKNSAYSSESEAESCAIDCAAIDESTPAVKHSRLVRSISTDGLIERQAPLWFPPSPGSKRNQGSENDPTDGSFSLEFGSGKFSGIELKKIMADKKLEEIALADPKRAKRIMANRQSAARSKERKVVYISELESKVKILQAEATTLSAHLTLLQRDSAGLAAQNNELQIRLQAMEQQARLREALNEALSTEVQHLRLAAAQFDDSALSKQRKQAAFIRT